jgi:hypothetical protein
MGFRDGLDGLQSRAFAEFGEDATYAPAGHPERTLRVVFRNEGTKVVTETGATVTTRRPLCDVRTVDLAPLRPMPNQDVVTIRGVPWNVVDVDDDDGEGIVTLLLGKPKRYG